MAAIFDLATSISVDQRQTTYRAVSQSGTARTAIGSPLFYYFSVEVRPMYRDELELVLSELTTSRYGVDTITSVIPHGLVWADSNWVSPTVLAAVNAGNQVQISTAADTTLQALDWIQFSNHSKVYQLAESVTTNNLGQATISLNTGLTTALTTNPATSVVTGPAVQFNLLYENIPNLTTVPGLNGAPLYQYSGPFVLREVL